MRSSAGSLSVTSALTCAKTESSAASQRSQSDLSISAGLSSCGTSVCQSLRGGERQASQARTAKLVARTSPRASAERLSHLRTLGSRPVPHLMESNGQSRRSSIGDLARPLYIEAEVHDIALADDVLLALEAQFAGVARARFTLVLDE